MVIELPPAKTGGPVGPSLSGQPLNELMALTANHYSAQYGRQLLQWVTDCLALIAQYARSFDKNADKAINDKALADLATIKNGYNGLCAWAKDRPVF
jgi:hypothetical protein